MSLAKKKQIRTLNTTMNPKDKIPLPDPLARFYAAFERMQNEEEGRRLIEGKKLEHYTRLQLAHTQLLEQFGAQFRHLSERIERLERRAENQVQLPEAEIISKLNAVTAVANRSSQELPAIREELGRISNDFSTICDVLERGGMR
jgi:hypothetical protein